MKKFKPFTFFLFIITVLFLIFAPAIIRAGLDKAANPAQKESYRGILSLWQVSGWQPGAGSISAYLRNCIRSFENKNAYVFIEVTTLTPAKAAEKIHTGELPDIISFPSGFFDTPSLLAPLDHVSYGNAALEQSCDYRGQPYAFAYLVNPYLLFCNEDILYEKEIETSVIDHLNLDTLFKTAAALSFTRKEGKYHKEICGMAMQEEYISSPFASLAFFRDIKPPKSVAPEETAPALSQTPYAITAAAEKGLELFMNKQASFLIASASALATLKNPAKAPPAYRTCAFSVYSDMVQYLGVIKTEDTAKLNICKAFFYSLMSGKNTQRAEEFLCFPVTYMDELFAAEPELKEAYRLLMQEGVFPNAFEYAGIQKELKQYAAGALKGESASLLKIRSLLSKKLFS